jgi:hypothetical protein
MELVFHRSKCSSGVEAKDTYAPTRLVEFDLVRYRITSARSCGYRQLKNMTSAWLDVESVPLNQRKSFRMAVPNYG